jgi:hypothetical protein
LLDLGPIERNVAKQAYRQGQPLPDRIANAPELQFGLQLYLNAFFELDSERSHAMGLTRISWSSIKDYAIAYEFDEEQTEDLFFIIKRMDSANLERLNEKMDK